MRIRAYQESDTTALTRLFYETVHSVGAADYSPAQLQAWAPVIPDPALWHERMPRRHTLVAEESGAPVAFAELEASITARPLFTRQGSTLSPSERLSGTA